jgi:light-regulated signal transduction histidine kinase (bacteriophytochrome)
MNMILQNNQSVTSLRSGTDKELLILQEELKAVKESTSRFTSIVAHDLQASLRMVTGFLDLLSGRYNQQLDEKGLQYIGFAVKGAEKMKGQIKDLQLYASLSNDSSPKEAINLFEIVNDLAVSVTKLRDNGSFECSIEGLPLIFGKKKQISLLFEALLSNAVKFSGDEPPRIRVSAVHTGGAVIITLADKGMGFDPGFKEAIFDIFRKLHPDDGRFDGNGIGLALCKRICEIHGWDITAEAEPGKGASFLITIPELHHSPKF